MSSEGQLPLRPFLVMLKTLQIIKSHCVVSAAILWQEGDMFDKAMIHSAPRLAGRATQTKQQTHETISQKPYSDIMFL